MEPVAILMGLFMGGAGAILGVVSFKLMGSESSGQNVKKVPVNQMAEGMRVEFSGTAYSPQPLTSQTTGQQVVYLKRVKTEEYEQETKNVSRKGSKIMDSFEKWAPFYINDGTAMIRVNQNAFKPETQKLGSSFEQAGDVATVIGVASQLLTSSGRRTLGYKTTEYGIVLGQPLYAVGKTSIMGNELGLTNEKGLNCMITTRTEKQVRSANKFKWLGLTAFGGILILIGLFTLAIGLFT